MTESIKSINTTKSLSLSRWLYPKDELEHVMMDCLLDKTRPSEEQRHPKAKEEILFWLTEYVVSYGVSEAWMFLHTIVGYSLYSLESFRTVKYIRKKIREAHGDIMKVLTPKVYDTKTIQKDSPPEDTYQVIPELIDTVKTIMRHTPSIDMYEWMMRYAMGEERALGTGQWSHLLLYHHRVNTASPPTVEKTDVITEKIKRVYETPCIKEQNIHLNRFANWYISMEKKNIQNIMYYANSMSQSEWFACICAFGMEENVFTETDIERDLYVDEADDIDPELNYTMYWVLSFRYLVKILKYLTQVDGGGGGGEGDNKKSCKQTSISSNFTLKHNKREMELCEQWGRYEPSHMSDSSSSSNSSSHKPIYSIPEPLFRKERWNVRAQNKRFVKSYSMKREIENNLEFHLRDTPYWKKCVDFENIMNTHCYQYQKEQLKLENSFIIK